MVKPIMDEGNVIIRQAHPDDVEGIAYVHFRTWQTTYTGLMPDEIIQGLDINRNRKYWTKNLTSTEEKFVHTKTFVAIAEESRDADIKKGQIVGFINGGKNRDPKFNVDGEIYAIYILKEMQGKEIGRKLFNSMLEFLKSEKLSSMIIWVLKNNSASKFYSKMGGLPKEEKIDLRGSHQLYEIGYVWSNISDILL